MGCRWFRLAQNGRAVRKVWEVEIRIRSQASDGVCHLHVLTRWLFFPGVKLNRRWAPGWLLWQHFAKRKGSPGTCGTAKQTYVTHTSCRGDFLCREYTPFDVGPPHEPSQAFLAMMRLVICVEARLHEVPQQSRATVLV